MSINTLHKGDDGDDDEDNNNNNNNNVYNIKEPLVMVMYMEGKK